MRAFEGEFTVKTARRWILPAVLASLALTAATRGDDDVYHKIIYVRVGDEAPAIQLKDDRGAVWDSAQHCGKRKYVVIYFYMGDFMPACTREARAYSDARDALANGGAEVVGVSGDDVENHQRFKEKYQLRQTLLSDDKGDVGKAFGLAWSGGGVTSITDDKGKEVKLRRGITESRWTWVVGKDGTIIYKSMNVDPDEDARRVLKFLNDRNNAEQP